jgi:ATP-dependent RNA helicase SUPV3L1/SUV3
VRRADSVDGDIDTLSARIAQIRTWTYVSNRPGWLADPTHWQEKTREIEDRLSDALHERLTKRFVDRRTSVLMKRLRENAMLEAEISVNGDVRRRTSCRALSGFRFTPTSGRKAGEDAKAVRTPRRRRWRWNSRPARARLHAAGNSDFALARRHAALARRTRRHARGQRPCVKSARHPARRRALTGPRATRSRRAPNAMCTTRSRAVLKPLDDLKGAEH